MSQNRPFILIYTNSDYVDSIMDKFKQINFYSKFLTYDKLDDLNNFLVSEENKYNKPDLIIFDIDDFSTEYQSFLQKIKNDTNLRYISLIVLSNSDKDEDIVNAYNNYANSYIVKPKNDSEKDILISSIAGFWLSVVRFPNSE